MSSAEAAEFAALPGAQDAVQLRRFDEEAKVAGMETPSVEHFLPYIARCLKPAA
jgi:predicted HD phosphohydrolase